jgi:hypothetical protein
MDGIDMGFCGLYGFDLAMVLVDDASPERTASAALDRFIQDGGHNIALLPRQVVDPGENLRIL